jgi:drug/metabolite transporter (DMT)-like permease
MPIGEAVARARPAVLRLTVVAIFNAVLPFWLLAWGETRIDSGLAAVLQASAPLFTAFLAFFFVHSERLSGVRLLGVVAGFAGVALLVGVTPEGSVLAALGIVLTGCSYGAAALYAARALRGVPPLVVAFATTALATLLSAPAGIAQLPDSFPGWKVVGSVVMLGVVGLGFAYVLYFGLIAGAGASRAVLVTYLVPPMALFYGAAILDEPVKASAIGGLALILGGVALGSGNVRVLRRRTADSLKPS